jgi:spermidine synthase
MSLSPNRQNMLVLGAGDGLAFREILKYKDTEQITLVDLDPKMTELANTNRELLRLNKGSLKNDRVKIVHDDAFNYLMQNDQFYDVIIVDLPDPNNEALNKLYKKEFYSLIRNHLTPNGLVSIQSTSPMFATKVFWTINQTVQSTGMKTKSYHLDVPSFGNWGFTLASRNTIDLQKADLSVKTKFLNEDVFEPMFHFGNDVDSHIVEKGKNT